MENPPNNQPSEYPLQRNPSQYALLSFLIPKIPPKVPILPPTVPSNLTHQPILERTTEVIRYSILNLDYSLSPSGALRQWVKLNALLLLWFGIPTFCFVPVITCLMNQFASLTSFFQASVQNLLQTFLPLFILAAIISVIAVILKK